MSYSSTDVAHECQISRLSRPTFFSDNTSHKLPSAMKALYTRRDSDCKKTLSEE